MQGIVPDVHTNYLETGTGEFERYQAFAAPDIQYSAAGWKRRAFAKKPRTLDYSFAGRGPVGLSPLVIINHDGLIEIKSRLRLCPFTCIYTPQELTPRMLQI